MAIAYYVFLNDGETYSGLEGAFIVGVDEDNHRAQDALDSEDFDVLFRRADLVVPVPQPTTAASRRRRAARGRRAPEPLE